MFPIAISISEKRPDQAPYLTTTWTGQSIWVSETNEALELPFCNQCSQTFNNRNSVFKCRQSNALRCEMCVGVDEDGTFDEGNYEYLADYETTVIIKQVSDYANAGAMEDEIMDMVPNALVTNLGDGVLRVTNIDNEMIVEAAKAALYYAEGAYKLIYRDRQCCDDENICQCEKGLQVAYLN